MIPYGKKYHHAVLVCGSKTFTFAHAPSSRADIGRCKASDGPLPAPRPGIRLMFLITINILLLIVGMILDIFAALVIMAPLIIPIALAFGVDPCT